MVKLTPHKDQVAGVRPSPAAPSSRQQPRQRKPKTPSTATAGAALAARKRRGPTPPRSGRRGGLLSGRAASDGGGGGGGGGSASYRAPTESSRNRDAAAKADRAGREVVGIAASAPADVDGQRTKTDLDDMLEAQGFSADELWERQKNKSSKLAEKTTELARAKQIFGALRDQAHSKHRNMFKAFQKMDLNYDNDEDAGTLRFEPFYKALQGLYFDRLVSRQEAHDIFDLVDRDKSGAINYEELQAAFDFAQGALGAVKDPNQTKPKDPRYAAVQAKLESPDMTIKARQKLTDAQMIEQKKAQMRLNELKYQVLDKVMATAGKKPIREALRLAYKEADANQDGNLSYDEFSAWLGNGPGGLNLGFTTRDIRDLTLACDRDLDGGIDCKEFIDTMSRKDRPDPRTFLNECRSQEVSHMRKEKEREAERLRENLQQPKRMQTPEFEHGELSTRIWYTEDYEDGVYESPEVKRRKREAYQRALQASQLLGAGRVGGGSSSSRSRSGVEFREGGGGDGGGVSQRPPRSPGSLAPLRNAAAAAAPALRTGGRVEVQATAAKDNVGDGGNDAAEIAEAPYLSGTSAVAAAALASSGRRSRQHARRSRTKRRSADTFDATQRLLKEHVHQRTLNPGMVSRLNFEDFGKQLPQKRPDKGQAFKPVWANRLTFDRIGLGGPGVDRSSPMFLHDDERLGEVRAGANVNPASKYCHRELRESVARTKALHHGKRHYLKKRKGHLRKNIAHRTNTAESAIQARIRSKTFQRLRFLEVMHEVEERSVKGTYYTKGLIKSPVAARNQAGTIMLFRPPSPRGRRVDTLQIGIGTRPEANVEWRY